MLPNDMPSQSAHPSRVFILLASSLNLLIIFWRHIPLSVSVKTFALVLTTVKVFHRRGLVSAVVSTIVEPRHQLSVALLAHRPCSRFNILVRCDDDFIHWPAVRHLYPCPMTRLTHLPGHAEYLLTPRTSVNIFLGLAPPARIVVGDAVCARSVDSRLRFASVSK